jgi:hypothetical protein
MRWPATTLTIEAVGDRVGGGASRQIRACDGRLLIAA